MSAESPVAPAPATNYHGTGPQSRIYRPPVFKVFAVITVITFLLRIFYANHLYQDDGLWFTVGEELLRGKALYRDIYFDKPPAIALIYAGLFKLFGAHILTIRLFTMAYSVAISAAIYRVGKRIYSSRIGLLAAVMFAVFSTLFTTGHVQGLNTDLLMALPYTAAAYFWFQSCSNVFGFAVGRWPSARYAFVGGILIGIAAQINPKGVFGLIFLALLLFLTCSTIRLFFRLSWALVGFVIGTLPFVIYIAATGALGFYWRYVWVWGARYASYYPTSYVLSVAVGQTALYLLLNNTLLIGLAFVIWNTYKASRRAVADTPAAKAGFKYIGLRADVSMLLWLAVSFIAMSTGGRFFGHYFFQVMPVLCLIAARGVIGIYTLTTAGVPTSQPLDEAAEAARQARLRNWRYALLTLLVIGFAVTMVRFHTRTVGLAVDWLCHTKSTGTRTWFHERLKTEERLAAATVRNLETELPDAVEQMGIEALRKGGPRERSPQGPSDYLYVWGYRPEIYYWSGLLPASKYLSSQPLTGVPADVNFFSDYRVVLDERDTSSARQELAQELERVKPEYIVDELGFFNANLAMARYGEFTALLSEYRNAGSVGRFIIYHRRDFIKARKQEKESEDTGKPTDSGTDMKE